MIVARIEVDGHGELLAVAADLGRAQARARREGRKAVEQHTRAGATEARRLAAVDTGHMRSVVTSTVTAGGADTWVGEWGDEADYARYVEYGTSKMRAQPFIGPSLDRVAPRLEADVEGFADPLN